MEMAVQMISTVGFPIVAVIGMAFFFYKMWTLQNQQNINREETLMNLIRELSTNLAELGRVVDRNTEKISILSEKIDHMEEDLEEGR